MLALALAALAHATSDEKNSRGGLTLTGWTTYAFDREVQSSLARNDIPADPDTFRARNLAKRRIVCTLVLANPIDIYEKNEQTA